MATYPFNFSFGAPSPSLGQMPRYPFDFEGGQEEQEPENPYAPPIPPRINFADAYRELLSRPKGKAAQAYEDFVQKGYPQERPPNWSTRLGAALSGAAQAFSRDPGSSFNTARSIIQAPYEREVKRHQLEGNRLAQAAALEEKDEGRNLQIIKAFDEMENRRIDNERLQAQADEAKRVNNANIKAREQQAINSGLTVIEGSDGHRYSVSKDGKTKTDLGKYDLSVEEKKTAAKLKAKEDSDLIAARQRTLAGINFDNAMKLQRDRERATDERTTQRIEAQVKRDAARKGITQTSEVNKMRRNRVAVEAMVASDPDRFKDIWTNSPDGYMSLTSKPPDYNTDPEAYEAYRELYNLLYQGVVFPDGSSAILGPPTRTTKGGNKIIK